MNILFLSKSGEYAGSTYSILYLAKGLQTRGHSIFVCCPHNTILFRELEKSNVTVIPMSMNKKAFSLVIMREIAHEAVLNRSERTIDRLSEIISELKDQSIPILKRSHLANEFFLLVVESAKMPFFATAMRLMWGRS